MYAGAVGVWLWEESEAGIALAFLPCGVPAHWCSLLDWSGQTECEPPRDTRGKYCRIVDAICDLW